MTSGGTPSKYNPGYWGGDVPWASSKDLKVEHLEDTEDHITREALEAGAARLVSAGSLLVVVRGMILAHTFPVAKIAKPMAINQDLKALQPVRDLNADYLAWLLRGAAPESLARCDEAAHGTKVLRMDDWGSLLLPLPPISEQQTIARFLARETAKIDALVGEQERLIGLLEDKREGTISDVATKGLNPKVPMRMSGAAWVGAVPSHWQMVPLMALTDPLRPIMYGIVLPGPDVGDGVPILKGGNVKPSKMNLASMARTTPEIEARYARARLRHGDLVYSIRGSIGECEQVPPALTGANITQDVARIAPAPGIQATWLRWVLLSSPIREELASGSLGAAVRGINIFDLKRVCIPTPPFGERALIGEYLDCRTAVLDDLIADARSSIVLLRSRRSALIAAAVTGQIDVRGVAATEAA